jgi:O-antigen ligase
MTPEQQVARHQRPPQPDGDRTWFASAFTRDEEGRVRTLTAWPLWALLVPFPLWWAIGLGSFAFPLFTIPMAYQLWKRRRAIVLPRGWPLWALFMIWNVLGLAMLGRSPHGTHGGSITGRGLSILVDFIEYGGASVTAVYVASLTEKELPLLRLTRWLAVLFVVTVGGGLLGTFVPHFEFTSPIEMALPGSLRSNAYVSALVHPNAAQVQSVLGDAAGRAAAPFGYTNYWANCLSILLVFFVVAWGMGASRTRRLICLGVIALSMVPIVYSLNRGLWIGLAASVVWVALRLFLRGKVLALCGIIAAVAVGVSSIAFTPLGDVFNARLQNGKSDSIRTFLTQTSINAAEQSPILGWGGARKTNGSSQSIAIGRSAGCPRCGDFPTGSTGQLWSVLFNNGIVGTMFFLGFFAWTIWTYRRDRSAVGQAAQLVVGLTFVYMLFYSSMPAAFSLTAIAVGMLAKSDRHLFPAAPARGNRLAPASAAGVAS